MINQDLSSINNPEPDIEVQKLLLLFRRRWQLGLIILIVSIILSAIFANYGSKTKYVAVGKLLYKNVSTSELTGIDVSSDDFETLERNSNPIITEIEVIKSIPVAEATIQQLQLTNEEGEPMEAAELLSNVTAQQVVATDIIEVSYTGDDPDLSLEIADKLIANYLNKGRQLSTQNLSKALRVIVEQQLPAAQEQIRLQEHELQKFREKYQIFSFEQESQALTENLVEIEQEIEEAELQLKEARTNSIELQRQIGMNSQEAINWTKLAQSPIMLTQVEDLQELQGQIAQEKKRFSDDHPTIVALQNQASDLENSLQRSMQENLGKSSEFSLGNLQILQQKNLSPELTSSLLEAEAEKQRLTIRLNNLISIKHSYEQKIAQLPKLGNDYQDIKLQLETAQSKYELLLSKSQELNLARQQPTFDNVRILEPAQIYPVNSGLSPTISIGIGGFLGIMLGISAMVGIDLIDNFIKSPEEISKIFGYKILGSIPDLYREINPISERKRFFGIPNYLEAKIPSPFQSTPRLISNQQLAGDNLAQKGAMIPVKESPNSLGSKAFWMLQAKIKLLEQTHQDNREKIVVISSSLAQEGKSMVTANLALTLSQLGEKVLIIDGNLHNPKQRELWTVGNFAGGLSEVVLSQTKVNSAIIRINENLDLLTSGIVNCNPLKIIDSMKMKQLLWELGEKYNLILIDSPALEEVPDALSLAKIADGMLLVAGLGKLTYQGATKCKDLLDITGVNVIGLVVNGFS